MLHRVAGWAMRRAGLAVALWVVALVAVTAGSTLVGQRLQERQLAARDGLAAGDRHLRRASAQGTTESVQIVLHDENGLAAEKAGSAGCWPRSAACRTWRPSPIRSPANGSLSTDGRTAYATVDARRPGGGHAGRGRPGDHRQGAGDRRGRAPGRARRRSGPGSAAESGGGALGGRRHPGRAGDPGLPLRIAARGQPSAAHRGLRGRQHARPAGARLARLHHPRLHRAGDDAGRSRRRHRLRAADLLPLPQRAAARAPTANRPARIALDTAGRSVLFAGCTVVIALLGLLALGTRIAARAGARRDADRADDHARRGHPAARAAHLVRQADRAQRPQARGQVAAHPATAGASSRRLVQRGRGSRWCSDRCPGRALPAGARICGSASRTPARTTRRRPAARRTTCWRRDSGRASTVR